MLDIDKTTLADLSVFNTEEGFSVFHFLNLTLTSNGKDQLYRILQHPMDDYDSITAMQETIQLVISRLNDWPAIISNGTIKVIERFYETAIDAPPAEMTSLNTFTYKIFHGPDYSLLKYSSIHCFDFIRGMKQFLALFPEDQSPPPLRELLADCRRALNHPELSVTDTCQRAGDLGKPALLQFGRYIRFRFRQQMIELLHLHARLDAWFGMAKAVLQYGLQFPTFSRSNEPFMEARGLYHILLQEPVSYDVRLHPDKNFMFLTGANMAGKSTFIKSVGIAVFLAHLGMGVPAKSMSLSVFNGLLSNINVADNIVRGESYFFNEVQRIKGTIQKINDGRRWLILIDELFKGTNVQDAMKCSSLVIEGLLKMPNALFILSTHLYEIGDALRVHPNIQFSFFETSAENGQLHFSYHLKEGISNDRFGYLILKREGVVDMLDKLG